MNAAQLSFCTFHSCFAKFAHTFELLSEKKLGSVRDCGRASEYKTRYIYDWFEVSKNYLEIFQQEIEIVQKNWKWKHEKRGVGPELVSSRLFQYNDAMFHSFL